MVSIELTIFCTIMCLCLNSENNIQFYSQGFTVRFLKFNF